MRKLFKEFEEFCCLLGFSFGSVVGMEFSIGESWERVVVLFIVLWRG